MTPFGELGLIEALLRAVAALGHTQPTPIQVATIPLMLDGRDVCATAQTGTGKTGAFALPILQRLSQVARGGQPRALVLVPTRELAAQVGSAFDVYGQFLPTLRCAVVYGGLKQRAQRRAVEGNPEIIVATPGRLIDLCGQGKVDLGGVKHLVIDEADRMLDLGFIDDVNRVLKRIPTGRQTSLFSATLPPAIAQLASRSLRNAVRVSVAADGAPAPRVEQGVVFVEHPEKSATLLGLLDGPAVTRALVFVRTKHAADRLARVLLAARVQCEAIHGDRPQSDRERALARFKGGVLRVLVATDVAARGIDIDHVSHVVNFDVPNVAETYVHRIGRTARAGAGGIAITLCAPSERGFVADIERLIGQPLAELSR